MKKCWCGRSNSNTFYNMPSWCNHLWIYHAKCKLIIDNTINNNAKVIDINFRLSCSPTNKDQWVVTVVAFMLWNLNSLVPKSMAMFQVFTPYKCANCNIQQHVRKAHKKRNILLFKTSFQQVVHPIPPYCLLSPTLLTYHQNQTKAVKL